MTNPDIFIFGYVVSGANICTSCFTKRHKSKSFDVILRSTDASKFALHGLTCAWCGETIFFPTTPEVPEVFQEFIETLEF